MSIARAQPGSLLEGRAGTLTEFPVVPLLLALRLLGIGAAGSWWLIV